MGRLLPCLIIVSLLGGLCLPVSVFAEVDNYIVYASGNMPAQALTVAYNEADDNLAQIRTNNTTFGYGVEIYLDGSRVCSGAAICTYQWFGTENSNHTLVFVTNVPTGASWQAGGRRNLVHGANPYRGVQHWSAYPKIMYGRTDELVRVYNSLVSGLVNSTLVWYVAMGLVAIIAGTIIRSVFSALTGAGGAARATSKTSIGGRGSRSGSGRGVGGGGASSSGGGAVA